MPLSLSEIQLLVKIVVSVFREFSSETFILGFRYKKRRQNVCQLLNFILGEAKTSIYVSRKNKIKNQPGDDELVLFPALVKVRILIDYQFSKLESRNF